MLYAFEDVKTRERVVLEFDHQNVPVLFARIKRKGRTLERVAALPEISVQRDLTNGAGGALHSSSLPLNWPYAKQHDKQGHPVFETHREAHEAVARAKDDGEHIHAYDSEWGKN